MKAVLLSIGVLFALNSVQAQSAIYLADKSILFIVHGDDYYSPDGQNLLYFKKGNIFFTGQTDDRQNIFLLTTSTDIFTEKAGLIYEKENQNASFSFREGKVYAGASNEEDDVSKELLHIEKSGRWMAFYSSISDSLLAYYDKDSLSPAAAVITAYSIVTQYGLEKQLSAKTAKSSNPPNEYSSIEPMWGNVTANEWIWDGETLRPRWSVDPRSFWTFDGQTIKQKYESNIYEQYEWDGENFKPMWRTNQAQEWSWDGRILKPTWSTDWANEYTIADGEIKPWSNVHPDNEWRIDGDIPIPVIILVISGIARAY